VKEGEKAGTCITHGREEKCVQNFSRKPEGKRPHCRPRRIWEENVRMNIREIVCEVVINVGIIQRR